MTDNEIIKAMNYCCGNIEKDGECKEDMCYQAALPEDRDGDIRWCRQWLMKDALDLINRQKAEIERLYRIIADKDYSFAEVTSALRLAKELLETEKSEAIKEFAERLKKYAVVNEASLDGEEIIDVDDIDNIVKEMTEV